MHRPHEGRAHRRGRAEDAVETGGRDHVDDGADAAPLLTDAHGPGALELDLGGRVGAVAELVLEALHPDLVATPVVEHPGEEEAPDAGVGLREHEEAVAHRGRAEPLVPREPVGLTLERATGRRDRPRRGGPHVGAALLLGHPHAEREPGLVAVRPQHGVVGARGEAGDPAGGDGGLRGERRDRGIRHRHRAEVSRLDLRPHDEAGGPPGVGAAAGRAGPRLGGQAGTDGDLHEVVVRRVELHRVDPLAGRGVRAQRRRDPVGLVGPGAHPLGAGEGSEVVESRGADRVVGRHPPLDGLREGRVAAQHVEAARGRDDVGDDVGPHHPSVRRLPWAP